MNLTEYTAGRERIISEILKEIFPLGAAVCTPETLRPFIADAVHRMAMLIIHAQEPDAPVEAPVEEGA